jgi:hypothetical protein
MESPNDITMESPNDITIDLHPFIYTVTMQNQCVTVRAVHVLTQMKWLFSSNNPVIQYELSLPPEELFDIFRVYKKGTLNRHLCIKFPTATENLKTHVINIVKILTYNTVSYPICLKYVDC